METTLERSIVIPASRELVWQAVTEPEQIVKWFVPNLPGAELKREDNGKLVMYLYGMGVDFLSMEMVETAQKVVIHSLPDHLLTITYTFEDQQGGTLMKVTLTGFEALVGNLGQDRLHFIGMGWEKALDNLKAYLNGLVLPFPKAFVGSLFGYWREPQTKLAIERSIWIAAQPERVWRAITDPKQLQAWLSPATAWQLSALEIGGRFYVHDVEADKETYVEIIEVLDSPSQLTTRSIPEAPDTVVKLKTYQLTQEKGGTRLTLTLMGYEQDSEDSRWNRMEENAFGFGMMLQNTKAYLEGQNLPFPAGF